MSAAMSESTTSQLTEWQQKLDALQVRERVLLFAVAVVVVVALLQMLLIEPVMKKKELLNRQFRQVSNQLVQQKAEKQGLEMILAAGVNKSKIARRDKLKEEKARLDSRIQDSILTLIPPKLMPVVLEKMLVENNKLKLVSLENKPVVALISEEPEAGQNQRRNEVRQGSDDKATASNETQGLYKHTFVLRLEGSYPAAVEYFEALSELQWRFNWDAMHYEVIRYPKASISLEVHTVSMSEGWIGV